MQIQALSPRSSGSYQEQEKAGRAYGKYIYVQGICCNSDIMGKRPGRSHFF